MKKVEMVAIIAQAPLWGLTHSPAEYYGWRWCLHVGPWLIFYRKCEPRP